MCPHIFFFGKSDLYIYFRNLAIFVILFTKTFDLIYFANVFTSQLAVEQMIPLSQ